MGLEVAKPWPVAVSTAAAVRAGAGDVADLGQRVEIEDADVPGGAGARDVEIAAIGVGGHVIESAIAADQLNFLDFVGASLCMGDARSGSIAATVATAATSRS